MSGGVRSRIRNELRVNPVLMDASMMNQLSISTVAWAFGLSLEAYYVAHKSYWIERPLPFESTLGF